MYRLCVKYTEAKLEDLADVRGYANIDEMCEDLVLDKACLLRNYVPIDVTTKHLSGTVYMHQWQDIVYAVVRVNEAEFEPFLYTTRVYRAAHDDVVWVDESQFLDDSDEIIPLQYL